MTNEKTISQLLAEAGYSHQSTADFGPHRITRTATGEVIGFMYHNEAAEFLHSLKAAA